MSIKRMIPIILLLTLVVGLAACQMDRLEEGVQATAEKIVAQKGETPDIDESAHVEADKDEIHEETAAKEEAADEHQDVEADGEHENSEEADEYANMEEAIQAVMNNLPEFVPPKPAVLDIEGDALAYAMGDPDAPVQIIEFTDYQCPFCARHSVATMPDVIENLVDSGRIFYGIKDLPLDTLHPEARTASSAARCAGEQDAYMQMHDVLFITQADWSGIGEDADDFFVEVASGLDLDPDAFAACLTDGSQADHIQNNLLEAQSLGVASTPFFFVNGHAVSGAQPYELFEAAVGLAENGKLDAAVEAQARQAYDAQVVELAAQLMPQEPVEVSMDNAFAIGDADAPVTIVEYTDYQCPFCARHAVETFGRIKDELVETGQVRYVFKDLPLTHIHPQATLAAEAARCAGAQDETAFVEMHDLIFENQRAWSGNGAAADLFVDYAAEIGLDGDSFTVCLESHEMATAVEADMAEAQALGINGTPAFLINGQQVFGAQPFEIFAQAVESLIAEAPTQPLGS